MSRNYSSALWKYFKAIKNSTFAECNICHRNFSYKTSVTNLKRHLWHKHKTALQELLSLGESYTSGDKKKAQDVGSSLKFSSEIWRHFEHDEEDEEVRCSACRDSLPATIKDMKAHLEEHHTSVLDDIIAKAQSGLDSDNEIEGDNVYTEVVYLEEDVKPNRRTTKRKISEHSPSPEPPKKQKSDESDELEMFINYMRCLIKKVPKELSAKLQLDIINLIVNARNQRNTVDIANDSARANSIKLAPQNVMMPDLYVASPNVNSSINSISVSLNERSDGNNE